jgi:hypothetical protein
MCREIDVCDAKHIGLSYFFYRQWKGQESNQISFLDKLPAC